MNVRAWWGLGALALALAGCGDDTASPGQTELPEDMTAEQVLLGIEHTITTDGVRRARLDADTAYRHESDERVDLRGVHLVLFDETGARTATITSRAGELNTRSQMMVARDDVVVVTNDGRRRVETEELHYDPSSERIWSDVETWFYQDDDRGRGDGFTSDGLRDLQVRNPSGTIHGWDRSP